MPISSFIPRGAGKVTAAGGRTQGRILGRQRTAINNAVKQVPYVGEPLTRKVGQAFVAGGVSVWAVLLVGYLAWRYIG